MRKKIIFGIIFLILFLGIREKIARAQQIVKFAAIPPRVEDLIADPGETVTRQIRVRNLGESEMAIQAKVLDFIVEDQEGTPVFLREETVLDNRWAMSLWINVSPTRFTIKPGETKELDLVVVVPEDGTPGGHYAAVAYEAVDSYDPAGGSGTQVVPTVATLLYLKVRGDIAEDALVKRLDIPKFSEFGPIPIESEIENLSDIHIRPVGTIRIYGLLNRLATTLKLDEKNIFPGKSKIYENTWSRKWLFGRYQANLEAFYGDQGQLLQAVAYFWVIPWKALLVVLLIIVLVILLLLYSKGKKKLILEK